MIDTDQLQTILRLETNAEDRDGFNCISLPS